MRRFIYLAALAAAVSGCRKPATAVVQGAVTLDGTVPAIGFLTFEPADGLGPTGVAALESGGRYRAELPPGPKRVAIRLAGPKTRKRLPTEDPSLPAEMLVEAAPARYNERTELTVDLKPGDNTADFALTSDPPAPPKK